MDRSVGMSIAYVAADKTEKVYLPSFFVRPGDRLKLRGEVAEGSMEVTVERGTYRDPSVRRLFDLEMGCRRSGADVPTQEFKDLEKRMKEEVIDNEYAVSLFLNNLHYIDLDGLKVRYASLTPKTKGTYMGGGWSRLSEYGNRSGPAGRPPTLP
jgi:hypothetical protein